jgi:carbon-monoxide dehydrogenase iron sulfur subunit
MLYDPQKCLGCRSCELACSIAHSLSGNLHAAIREEKPALPRKKVFSVNAKNFPVSCRHCQEPACVDACMAAALKKADASIEYDPKRCVGCWMCVMACPYGAIRPDLKTRLCVRCDKCKGKPEPACVKACPTKAIIEEVKR